MSSRFAFLSDGKLFLVDGNSAPRLIDSHFAQDLIDRRERNRQRNDWKSSGMAWQFNMAGMRPPNEDMGRNIRINSLTMGGGRGELLYGLDTGAVGGLFLWDPADNSERRLFHRANFHARDAARHPVHGLLAVSVATSDGAVNLATMEATGKGVREITEGDSLDESPSWAPGDSKQLIYQSAGIARNAAGAPCGIAPYGVYQLDLDKGDMTTLAEDEAYDFLCPHLGGDGTLYYIRRPYQAMGHTDVSPLKVLKDIVFFPFRLVLAIVHFLNWFSLVFRRKPLLTAGGPPKEGPDSRYMMLWGKLIDAEKAIKSSKADDAPGLVPKNWELIRRRTDGVEDVIASGVLSFDLGADGSVIYTNGTAVFSTNGQSSPTQLCKSKMIERILAVVGAPG